MPPDLVENPSAQVPLHVFQSGEEAERYTERWLTHLAENGRHGWERVEPLQLKTQPTPNLPCRLLGMTGENPGGGHSPLFMLMAGKRRRRRYWQYITRDVVTGEIHSPEVALDDIEWIVDALSLSASGASRFWFGGGRRVLV